MQTLNFLKCVAVATALLLFGACRSAPPVQPIADQATVLVAQIQINPIINPGGLLSIRASRAWFARLDGKKVDSISEVIPANWVTDDRAYLLNAPPGEYVLVAAYYEQQKQSNSASTGVGGGTLTVTVSHTPRYLVLLDGDSIDATRTTSEKGKVTIMGKVELGLQMDRNLTPIHNRVANLIGNAGYQGGINKTKGRLESGAMAESDRLEILEEVQKDFADSAWASYL